MLRRDSVRAFLLGTAVAGLGLPGIAAGQSPPDRPVINLDAVVITAPVGGDRASMVEGTSVLEGETLNRLRGVTIGETLDRLPGMSQTSYGTGASRPIIRGLGGARVRTLNNGIDSLDASVTSPDHAVLSPTLGTRRIEVLRGPATLMYGGGAVGGVVNTIDDRIPDAMPKEPFGGTARAEYGTHSRDKTGFASADGALGKNVAVHAEGFTHEVGDYKIDGYASNDARNAGIKGRVRNSYVSTRGGSLGTSAVGEQGYGGVAISQVNNQYGIPRNVTAVPTTINMHQLRYDAKAGLYEPVSFLEEARFKIGYSDYKHDERSGSTVNSTFFTKAWDARGEFLHKPIGDLKGVAGVQISQRDFEVVGNELFIRPTVTDTDALFLVETYELGPWLFSGGGRLEQQKVAAALTAGRTERNFTGRSASGSATYRFDDTYSLGASISRTERAPTAEELFANGPHDATSTFERGNSNLRKEIGVNTEIALRKRKGDVTGGVSVYRTKFKDFISEQFTGEVEDDLNVIQFTATKAEFRGIEVEAGWLFLRHGAFAYSVDGVVDYVRAQDETNNRPLPRIPAFGYTFGLNAESDSLGLRMEIEGAAEQDRVSANETTTDGYTFLNASATYRLIPERGYYVGLRGRNLTNTEGRNHVSYLKADAPFRGREVWLTAALKF